ncbi:MAG: TonB-dependent receptor [Cyclobacteriaceae bacterium]|nr:TonB-dependent receptor [Cyclobacteriaceae bacterium]
MDRIVRLIKLTSAVILLLISADLHAQKRAISGVVKTDKETLPGVTVVEKGTTNGTVTDVDGKFTLMVSEGATLSLTFIGMKAQEISIGTQTSINVNMESDVTQLNDVVVVGYGVVERKDLTTSVSSVGAKQLVDIPINNTGQALAGRLAGVQVVTNEGSPNAQVQIRVRGGGSITQDNNPIYVVDGIQVENALNVIAPQDIQSIDVLKDASATAIYGARGANGVVIITTKGGREQKMQVSYSGLVGVRTLANKLEVMNPYDFVFYQYERSRGNSTSEGTFRRNYGNFSDIDLYKQVPFTDWQDETFGRSAVMQTHNISVSGGSTKTQYNVSLTSNTEQGIQLGSDFDRKLITTRLDHKFTNWLKVGANVRYNYTVVNGAGTSTAGSSSTNRLRQSVRYRPFLFPGQTTETYDPEYAQATNSNSLALVNPILLAQAEYQKNTSDVINVNGYVVVDPTPYLSIRSTLGYDYTNGHVDIFSDTITNSAKQNGQGLAIASINTSKIGILNNSNVATLSFHKLNENFAKHNKLDIMAGHELLQKVTNTTYQESHGFPRGTTSSQALANMTTLGTNYINPSFAPTYEVTERLVSFFGRATFSRDDKYMAVFSMRADGSSKFAEGHKWGYFPSASLAWRISNESFFEGARSTLKLSDFKLRLSYGQSGNNRINDFLYLPQFEQYPPYDLNNVSVIGWGVKRDGGNPALANNNLKWETTITQNLGIDIGFLEGKFQASVDIYHNRTQELIVNTPVPTSSGYANQLQNVGNTTNTGVEVQITATPIRTNAFSWKSTFNISFNKNNIETLGKQSFFLVNSGWNNNSPFDYNVIAGKATGTIWGLVSDGYYQIDDFNYSGGVYTLKPEIASNQTITALVPKPGVIKFKDLDGNGTINDGDRTALGNANPDFFGGWNNQFTYKNWDLSVFINFQYGNKVLNANKLEFTSGFTQDANLLAIMNNRFRNVNDEGQVVTDPDALRALNVNATLWTPLVSASSFYVNSWAVEDGSFIRINNITLGYTLPNTFLQKFKLTRFRVYGTVNNLAVFTNYSGYDPDVNTRRGTPLTPGVDYSAYPRSHAYIFGVNLTF